MGGIGGLIGLSGGAAGTGFSGPQQANLVNPTNQQQIQSAYNAAQSGLQSQQNLLTALQGQQGLQNQTSVYNQLQNVASGQGPNPAKAQLAQATGQNVAAQGALMAGQRGASANTGLIARQAAQQGAATQQQAVGQGATMQAQQSMNALQGLGGLATTMAGQQIGQTNALSQAQQAEQAQLLGAQAAYNSAQVGSQQSVNAANAGLAGTTMQGQQGLLGGAINAGGALLGLAKGGKIEKPRQYFPYGGGVYDTTSAPMSDQQWNSLASNPNTQPQPAAPQQDQSQPKSMFGNFIKHGQSTPPAQNNTPTPNYGNTGANALYQGVASLGSNYKPSSDQYPGRRGSSDMTEQYRSADVELGSGGDKEVDMPATNDEPTPTSADPSQYNAYKGGKVPAMVSPGEKYLDPNEVEQVKQGADPMQVGETIPGTPKVKGAKNSYANDTVPKDLDEGGIILPRSVTQGKNPHWAAMKFVYDTLKKGKNKK